MSDAGQRGGLELCWPDKYDADGGRRPVREVPEARRIERVERVGVGTGRVMLADNLGALQALRREWAGAVDLAYLDPPFGTGGRFSVGRRLGDDPQVAPLEMPAYDDRFEGGAAGLLAMLDDRLRLIHELLAPHGSLYVHVDPTVGHAVKLMLDEIFGPRCFQREIVWRIGWLSGFKTRARNWIRNHDLIFFYTKDPAQFRFNKAYTPYPEGYVRRDGKPPSGRGFPLEDVWNANAAEFALTGAQSLDSIQIKSFSREKTGWATQKNAALLGRIIEASSNPGDVVLDVFGGSGTTACAAHALGRRFIHCDRAPMATEITRGRLLDAGAEFELWADPTRECFAARAAGEVVVEVDNEGEGCALELHGVKPSAGVVEAVAAAGGPSLGDETTLDVVQGWCVEWRTDGDAEVLREGQRVDLQVAFGAHRTLHRRELTTRAPVPIDAVGARVRVYDVLGHASTVDLEW